MISVTKYLCPVCGFPGFDEPTHDEEWRGKHDICSSCGCQFGYTDAAPDAEGTQSEHVIIRKLWIDEGMPWRGSPDEKPIGWDPVRQMRDAGIKTEM